MISSGAKKDLLVINFAHAILESAKNPDVNGREVIPNHKNRNKIMRRCDALKEKCNDIFQSNLTPLGKKWFYGNMRNRVLPALRKAEHDNPQLESFAIYLLYTNFIDGRKKKVDEIFQPILDANDSLFETLDFIEEATGKESHEMNHLAEQTIQILKG